MNPTPPYPSTDSQALISIVKAALAKFESGGVGVPGAIMAAAQSAWAVGHQEGEDLCVGCAHRVFENLPARVAPHVKCLTLTMNIIETSLKTYIETWILLANQGAVPFPRNEADMRGAFNGLSNTFQALRLLAEQAGAKKGAT